MGGIYAPTLRYRDGTFYVITAYGGTGLVFTTTDPYDNDAWTDPVLFDAPSIDPDIFWEDDGTSPETRVEPLYIWNETGDASPEGPHMYKKDGYYYLMIAEGGTETGGVAVRLQVEAINATHYEFSAMPSDGSDPSAGQTLGYAPGALVSGGSGPFTGSLLGVYATCNGGDDCDADAYFGRWGYEGQGQEIGE